MEVSRTSVLTSPIPQAPGRRHTKFTYVSAYTGGGWSLIIPTFSYIFVWNMWGLEMHIARPLFMGVIIHAEDFNYVTVIVRYILKVFLILCLVTPITQVTLTTDTLSVFISSFLTVIEGVLKTSTYASEREWNKSTRIFKGVVLIGLGFVTLNILGIGRGTNAL